MLALRVARAATGRDRIVKLQEHFHGWSDVVSPYLDADGHDPNAARACPRRSGRSPRWCRADDPAGSRSGARTRRRRGRDHGAVRRALRPAPARPVFHRRCSRRVHRHRHRCSSSTRWSPDSASPLAACRRCSGSSRTSASSARSWPAVCPRAPLPDAPTCSSCSRPRSPIPGRSTQTRSAPPRESQRSGWSPTACPQRTADDYAISLAGEWTAALAAAGIPGTIRRLCEHPPHLARRSPMPRRGSRTRCAPRAWTSSTPAPSARRCTRSADLEQSAAAFARAIVVAATPA